MTTVAPGAPAPPAVPSPTPADWQGLFGAALAGGLNRWLDVEAYNRTGGAILPGGAVAPGAGPVIVTTRTEERDWRSMLPVLAIGAIVLVLVMRR